MKHKLILSGLLLMSLLPAHADTPAGGGAPPHKPFGNGELPEIMKPFDVNEDGKLSAEERQAFEASMKANAEKKREETIKKLDTDGDGKVSKEELKAAREAAQAKIAELRGKRFDELDTSKDGFLSLEEFAPPVNTPPKMVNAIFKHLDKDQDGKVSKEEFILGVGGPCVPQGPQNPPAGPAQPPVKK